MAQRRPLTLRNESRFNRSKQINYSIKKKALLKEQRRPLTLHNKF
jgi:hypothetical protein